MHRAALLALGILLALAGFAAAQGLLEGTFASTEDGCAKLKQKNAAELGDDRNLIVSNKTEFNAGSQRCDFVTVTACNATSCLATAFREELGYSYPDLFAILQKENGDLRVTGITVQQPSYDQTEEEPSLSADDVDPAKVGRAEGAGSNSPPPTRRQPPRLKLRTTASTPISAAKT
jgi:hypothetical protein